MPASVERGAEKHFVDLPARDWLRVDLPTFSARDTGSELYAF
jgi:hypothetical protein